MFAEKQVLSLYESELENQLSELKKQLDIPEISQPDAIPSSNKVESRSEMGDQPSMIGELTRIEVEILIRIIAVYQTKVAKKKDNVIKEALTDLQKHNFKNITENQINSIALRLVQKGFLKETATQFRKTDEFSPKAIIKAFNLVKN